MLNPVTPELALPQDRTMEWVAAATPVPDREILVGELDASLLTVILPVATPVAEGAKVEINVVDCPGERMTPLEPVVLNPAPATKTCAMVTLEFPTFVRVAFRVLLLATFTVPKSKLLELDWSSRVAAAETVSVAELLVRLPAALLTTTENCEPLSEAVVAGVV